jgi:hypothetical protein
MRPIRTREELIDFAARRAPSAACATALKDMEGALVLGAHDPAVAGLPGWIIKVTSQHGRVWILAVGMDADNQEYVCRQVDEIPDTYTGCVTGRPGIMNGDDTEYRRALRCQVHPEDSY